MNDFQIRVVIRPAQVLLHFAMTIVVCSYSSKSGVVLNSKIYSWPPKLKMYLFFHFLELQIVSSDYRYAQKFQIHVGSLPPPPPLSQKKPQWCLGVGDWYSYPGLAWK